MQGTLLLLLLIVLVPILLVQGGIYYTFAQILTGSEIQANLELARSEAGTFEAFIFDLLHQELAIGLALAIPEALPPEQVDRLLAIDVREFPALRRYDWLDPQGRVVTSSDPGAIGLDVSGQAYYQEIVARQEWSVSDLLVDRVSGELSFVVARGIRDEEGVLQGIVAGVVNPELLAQVLPIERVGRGAVAVYDRQGQLVFRFPAVDLPLERRRLLEDDPLLARALAGEEVSGVAFSPIDGQDRARALVPVPAIGWVASSDRPLAEVLGPVRSSVLRDLGLFLLVTGGAAVAALALSRRLTRPIDHLQEHSQALERGDLAHRTAAAGPVELAGLAATLNRASEELQLRQREREDFISIVSHDLRNPLTVVQTQAQLLQRSLQEAGLESQRRGAEAILTSSRRMNAMIQDLVDSARLEVGQLQLSLQPVDLRQFILDLLERQAGALDTERVRLQAPEGLPPALADPDRLERILLNLLTNALKYSAPGTEVTVSVAARDGEIVTQVTDRGAGIAPEDLPHLFERYYRAGAARERGEGLGLGLYITRMLVEAQGGRIWAESQVGVGSTFSFSLPVAL